MLQHLRTFHWINILKIPQTLFILNLYACINQMLFTIQSINSIAHVCKIAHTVGPFKEERSFITLGVILSPLIYQVSQAKFMAQSIIHVREKRVALRVLNNFCLIFRARPCHLPSLVSTLIAIGYGMDFITNQEIQKERRRGN